MSEVKNRVLKILDRHPDVCDVDQILRFDGSRRLTPEAIRLFFVRNERHPAVARFLRHERENSLVAKFRRQEEQERRLQEEWNRRRREHVSRLLYKRARVRV